MSAELITFLSAMLPLTELRGAIPLGYFYNLDPATIFLLAVIGNILPILIILKVLGPITNFLSKKSNLLEKIINFVFNKTRSKHGEKFYALGAISLITFVAIPLPGSGAYTGSLIAYLFGVQYKQAIALISTGVLISGVIVTAITQGAISLIS